MAQSKPTRELGPWNYAPIRRGFLNYATGELSEMKPAGYAITAAEPKMFGGTRILEADISEDHAHLIAEAGTVYHETGLTPRQLAEQRAELLAALKECRTSIVGYAITNSAQYHEALSSINSELQRIDKRARAAIAKAIGGGNG